MTEQREPDTTPREREPEVDPEVIEDLDATTDDADDVRGGRCAARQGAVQTQTF